MSYRLDQEREQRLQPERLERAEKKLDELCLPVIYKSGNEIRFKFKGGIVIYHPYSGWHSGNTITDGRGYKHLFKQLDEAK